LKTGGPKMTVDYFNTDHLFVCKWFDEENKLQHGEFDSNSLILATPDEATRPQGVTFKV
jgi:uncharacterized protein YodC (DUF2158 family)